MGDALTKFPEITDWSTPARADLVAAHRDQFSALLRLGFDRLEADLPAWLDAAHWKTVDDAVAWCLQAFATRDLRVEKAADATWRLFTIPWFWLKQKLGPGYGPAKQRVKLGGENPRATDQFDETPQRPQKLGAKANEEEDSIAERIDRAALQKRLGRTLGELRRCTCSQLVGWWLEATTNLRKAHFFPEEQPSATRSPKDASQFRADALARFQVLHQELIDDANELLEAVRLQFFSPCPGEPRHRLPDKVVVSKMGLAGVRNLQALRTEGWSRLLSELVKKLKGVDDGERPFLTASLSLTTLDVYGLDEGRDAELRERILQVPQVPRQGRRAR